jgi:Tol biopolymer transport system component
VAFDFYGIYAIGLESGPRIIRTFPETLITANGNFPIQPNWSPSRRWVAWASGDGDIFTIDVATREQTNLTRTPNVGEGSPAWSPDEKMIAFVSNDDGDADIYVMKADGTNREQLYDTDNQISESHPAWSPMTIEADGSKTARIAFSQQKSWQVGDETVTGSVIFVMDVTIRNDRIVGRGAPKQIETAFQPYVYYSTPSWSPDGTKIAFTMTWKYGPPCINPDTGDVIDEHKFLYTEVYVMNADGSNEQRLTFDGERECPDYSGRMNFDPDWSPSGMKLVFITLDLPADPEGWPISTLRIFEFRGGNISNLLQQPHMGTIKSCSWSRW